MLITITKAISFHDSADDGRARQCTVYPGSDPQLVPDWIRYTDSFKFGVREGSITVMGTETPLANRRPLEAPRLPHHSSQLPVILPGISAEAWRQFSKEFDDLADLERNLVAERLPGQLTLRARCTYGEGHPEFGDIRLEGGAIPRVATKFRDIATRAGRSLKCPPEAQPSAFWMHCLYRDCIEQGDRAGVVGPPESCVILGWTEKAALYCLRLAIASDEEAHTAAIERKMAVPDASATNSMPEIERDPPLDFFSDKGRIGVLTAYTEHWNCSEASLARTAAVDTADLSKWKKGALPPGSDKKARIEKTLRNNDKPTPFPNVRQKARLLLRQKSPTLAHKIANAPRLIANVGGCHDQNRDCPFNNCCRET